MKPPTPDLSDPLSIANALRREKNQTIAPLIDEDAIEDAFSGELWEDFSEMGEEATPWQRWPVVEEGEATVGKGGSDASHATEPAPNSGLGPIGPGAYEVCQGDCLPEIAFRSGHLEETIWSDTRNDAVKEKRRDASFLAPGDVLQIPEIQAFERSLATDQVYTFVRKGIPMQVKIRPLILGVVQAGVTCKVILDGGREIAAKTDDDGVLELAIPPGTKSARLEFESGEGEEYDLKFGSLDAVEEISGIQGRLSNLGYDCEISSTLDDETREALEIFQEDHGLPTTGEPDEDTRRALCEAHES